MARKFDPANAERLESPGRLALLPPDDIVSLLDIGQGIRVLDLGCGTGLFTIPLARTVGPSGLVVAADLRREMADACAGRIRDAGLANARAELCEESRLSSPAAGFDLVFACHLLHELLDPDASLAEVRRVLSPGGKLAVVEWEKVETGAGPPLEDRLTPAESRAVLERNGLRVLGIRAVTWANYLVLASPA